MKPDDFKQSNRTRRIRLALWAFLGLSCVVGLQALGTRWVWRKDLTRSKQYSLSAETRAYVKALRAPVELSIVCAQTGQAELLLLQKDLTWLTREFSYAARRGGTQAIRVRWIDPEHERHSAQALEDSCGGAVENSIVVSSGTRFLKIPIHELYSTQAEGPPAFEGEARLLRALEELEAPAVKVLLTAGHGEMSTEDTSPSRGLSALAQELTSSGAIVRTLDLMSAPQALEAAELVIIAGPQVPFEPQEVAALQKFGERGKLFIFLEALKPHGLEALLHDWGLQAPPALIEEVQTKNQTPEGDLLLKDFSDHPIVALLKSCKLHVLAGLARPLLGAETAPEGIQHATLMQSSRTSFARGFVKTGQQVLFSKKPEHVGPLCLALLAERPNPTGKGPQLILFGNADCISNGHLKGGNLLLLQKAYQHTLKDPRPHTLSPKVFDSLPLTLDRHSLQQLAWALCALPGLLGLMGLLLYFRRI